MSFDIAAYKKQHGTHDLEVVIAPDGGIAYAIPSHQEYMIARAPEKISKKPARKHSTQIIFTGFIWSTADSYPFGRILFLM